MYGCCSSSDRSCCYCVLLGVLHVMAGNVVGLAATEFGWYERRQLHYLYLVCKYVILCIKCHNLHALIETVIIIIA